MEMLKMDTLGSSGYDLMTRGENEGESGKDASQAAVPSSVDGQYTLQKVSFRAKLHHRVFGTHTHHAHDTHTTSCDPITS